VVRTLQNKHWHVALRSLLSDFVKSNGEVTENADLTAIMTFILDRVRKLALDGDVRPDIVAAGTALTPDVDVVYIVDRTQTLANHADDDNFRDIIEALTRVSRLAMKQPAEGLVDESLFENQTEQALFIATQKINLAALESQGGDAVYSALAELQKPIADYFDMTMVNADNESVKNNRYLQLHMIDKLISALGDLEQIVIK